MAVQSSDAVLDGTLDIIATADEVYLCAGEQTTRANAITNALAPAVTLTPGDGNGDFVIANGDTSGRKLTLGAQVFAVDTGGTADHIVLCTAAGAWLHTATVTSRVVADGDTANYPATDIFENEDPVAV